MWKRQSDEFNEVDYALRRVTGSGLVLAHLSGDLHVLLSRPQQRPSQTFEIIEVSDFALEPLDLLGGGIDTADLHTVVLGGVEHESAKTGADVNNRFARLEAYFPADVLDLVALCLLDCLRTFLPVRAGVHHQVAVKPVAIEIRPMRIMKPGIGPGLGDGAVGKTPLVPLVAQPYER